MDHGATSRLDKRVLEKMLPYFTNIFGNASSLHDFGQEAKDALDNARETVAKCIDAKPEEIVFTSGGSESDNLAVKGIAFLFQEKGKHIITSEIEHPAVLNTAKFLEKKGFEVTYLPVNKEGIVEIEDVKKAIRDDTILISIMHANNEIGTIQPIEEIGKITKEKNIVFHTDAVQTIGKIPLNVEDLNVDLLSMSAHKFYGPKGVGALYVRKGIKLEAVIHGGGHEKKLRAGTENVAGIVGLAEALRLATESLDEEMTRQTKMRDYMISNLLKIPAAVLNGHASKRLPGNVNIGFRFIEGEAMVLHLNMRGIAASTGSACSSHSLKPSHVLLALGLCPEEAHGSLRLTIGKENTEDDVQYVVKNVTEVIENLRAMSPLAKDMELSDKNKCKNLDYSNCKIANNCDVDEYPSLD